MGQKTGMKVSGKIVSYLAYSSTLKTELFTLNDVFS
jgi:hypothetical protein